MVNIINCSMKEFMQRTTGQEMIAFGAERLLESLREWEGIKQIIYIIDSDEKKTCTYIEGAGTRIVIWGKEKLRELKRDKNVVIITAALADASILKELDSCEYIDKIDCYILPLMINKDEAQQVFYPTGEQKIHKVIHYCWFGKTEIPSHLKKCMESWRKYCPDYERIDIVHQYGGIYLDTDVEIIKSFDDLLCSSSFVDYVDMS